MRPLAIAIVASLFAAAIIFYTPEATAMAIESGRATMATVNTGQRHFGAAL
jgi:hypothetical protein